MDNVSPIRGSVTLAEGKQAFLDYFAQRYDEFQRDTGVDIVCTVFVFINADGDACPGYDTQGVAAGTKLPLYLSRALTSLQFRVPKWFL